VKDYFETNAFADQSRNEGWMAIWHGPAILCGLVGILCSVVCLFVCLGFNGTFSTNRLYRAKTV